MNNDWVAVAFMVLAVLFGISPLPNSTVAISSVFAAYFLGRGEN